MRISPQDRARVADAIREAERATSGEFICVLAQRAGCYEFYPLAWSVLLAMAVPWLLMVLTPWPLKTILIAQLAAFLIGFAVLSLPILKRLVVPRGVQRAAAYRAATEQFHIRGLARTPHRRGILLFVAQEERYARILADEGAAAVPHEHWKQAIETLVREARAGRHADGFAAALAHCARVMADPFPPGPDDKQVLPDKFFVLD